MSVDHAATEEGSIYDGLRESFPQLRPVAASKSTLTVMSALIEELVGDLPGRNVLISVFQTGEYWDQARDRYLRLAEVADVIALYSDAGIEEDRARGHVGVRVEAHHTREWVVVALGDELAVTLCGRGADGDQQAARDAEADEDDRLFEVLWSYDPEVTLRAIDGVLRAIAEDDPGKLRRAEVQHTVRAAARPDARAVAHAADRLTGDLLARVEQMRWAERQADRRTSQAKTAFLSRMGHELRNPLNAVMGYAQLLELGGAGDDTGLRIRQAGEHLLGLVDEVLDISQVESGTLAVELEHLDVGPLVLGAIDLIGTEAATRGVRVRAASALNSPLVVQADRRLVVEVLLNLLSNAVKFNREGGVVWVEVTSQSDSCLIAVRDDGPGIGPEDVERIFEPFERLADTAHLAQGTGLGLSLSRSMAAAMSGRIDVRSSGPGDTTFTLVLPLAA